MNFKARPRRVRYYDLDLKGIFGKFKGVGKALVAKLKAGGRVDDLVAVMRKNLKAASETLNKHPKGKQALQLSGIALGALAVIGATTYGLKLLKKRLQQTDFEQIPAFIKFIDAHPEWFAGDVGRRLKPFLNKLEALYQAGDVERGNQLLIEVDALCGEIIGVQEHDFKNRAAEIERLMSEAERTIKLDAMFKRRYDRAMRRISRRFRDDGEQEVKTAEKLALEIANDAKHAEPGDPALETKIGKLKSLVKAAFSKAKDPKVKAALKNVLKILLAGLIANGVYTSMKSITKNAAELAFRLGAIRSHTAFLSDSALRFRDAEDAMMDLNDANKVVNELGRTSDDGKVPVAENKKLWLRLKDKLTMALKADISPETRAKIKKVLKKVLVVLATSWFVSTAFVTAMNYELGIIIGDVKTAKRMGHM